MLRAISFGAWTMAAAACSAAQSPAVVIDRPPDAFARAEAINVLQNASDAVFIPEEDIVAVVRALHLIRDRFPETVGIQAGPDHTELFLYLSTESWSRLVRTYPDAREGDTLRATHSQDVDSVAAVLGATGFILREGLFRGMRIEVPRALNVWAASRLFRQLESVRFAGPEIYAGDSDRITSRVFPHSVHLTFRRAWGDCPSGCIHEQLYQFAYDRLTGDVTMVSATSR